MAVELPVVLERCYLKMVEVLAEDNGKLRHNHRVFWASAFACAEQRTLDRQCLEHLRKRDEKRMVNEAAANSNRQTRKWKGT